MVLGVANYIKSKTTIVGEGSEVDIMIQNVFMYLDSILVNLGILLLKVHIYLLHDSELVSN